MENGFLEKNLHFQIIIAAVVVESGWKNAFFVKS
jgi:hypothetical protein